MTDLDQNPTFSQGYPLAKMTDLDQNPLFSQGYPLSKMTDLHQNPTKSKIEAFDQNQGPGEGAQILIPDRSAIRRSGIGTGDRIGMGSGWDSDPIPIPIPIPGFFAPKKSRIDPGRIPRFV